ncbi:hypothetical protein [Xanthobacter versatilis]|uniref:hypothetical protein n=1 Tax=Xanthobacter autotrophicus (strain ATCC BAA-1158 / Py2) TaxID=78245 RepID=UPI0037299C76
MSFLPGQKLLADQLNTAVDAKLDYGATTAYGRAWVLLADGAAALSRLGLPTAGINTASGLLQLGSDGKIASTYLPTTSESYLGPWNASTNSPTLSSSTGTAGNYYLVSVAGTTTLNGISSWAVGDKVSFVGGVWTKIPNVAGSVSSVAGNTGAVTATQILDSIVSTRGSILYRGASGWSYLAPGTNGQALISGGSGANPLWYTLPTSYAWGTITGTPTTLAGYGISVASTSQATTGTDDAAPMTAAKVAAAIGAIFPPRLSTASGTAPSYSVRAWVVFNGTGTVSILASANVSSITDNGTGNYTVNFTTAFPDANYAVLGSVRFNTGNSYLSSVGINNGTTPTTSAVNIAVVTVAGGSTNVGTNYDSSIISAVFVR